MVTKDTLKEVILDNENTLNNTGPITKREGISWPPHLKKPIVLYGVRRSGKTYCLYDVFKQYPDRSLYIDFEDERLSGFSSADFQTLLEAFWELKPGLIDKEAIFLLDEIQNIPDWEKFVRRITEREKIRVFVTGSSSKMMPKELHTALRGRSWSIGVFPFSFKEFLAGQGIFNHKTGLYGKDKAKTKHYFHTYLLWGGFPELAFLNKETEKRKVIKEYIEAIFFKDLVERYQIKNIPLLETLQDKFFSSFSTKLSLTAVYKQLKESLPVSKDSLFLYYKHFLDSMIIFEVKKFTESFYKRVRNPAKIYLADPALGRKITSDNLGWRLENVVYLELLRRGNDIFYFENKNKCDFIVKNGAGSFSAVQVTWQLSVENEERECLGLLEAAAFLKSKTATLITAEEERTIKKNGIKINIIPGWKWLLQ